MTMKITQGLLASSITLILSIAVCGQQPDKLVEVKDRPEASPRVRSAQATITFTRKPTWRRIRNQVSPGLGQYVSVSAVLSVADQNNQPIATSVTLLARSKSGPFKTGVAETDHRGEARPQVNFDVPLGSLVVDVQACLTEDSSVCTEMFSLTLRNRVDLDINLDYSHRASRTTAESAIPIENTIALVASPRLQFNLFETESNWNYYRVGVYGAVPVIFQNRSLGLFPEPELPFIDTHIDREFGLGDFAAGVNMSFRNILNLDVAYNGRTGKVNLVDSIRNFSSPRAVNIGDGFESVDPSVEFRKSLGERAFFLATGSGSRAFHRSFRNGDRAERGDFYQAVVGLGFVRRSSGSALLLWGGRQHFGAVKLTQGGRTTTPFREQEGWVAGLTGIGLARTRVNPGAGLIVSKLGSEPIHVGFSLTVNFNLF